MAEPYYQDAGLRLFHGSCKDILPTLPDASYDSIVTDPPYEIGFMGKGWDSTGIAYDAEVWAECLRVLKPGGHLLAFGGTRTWHRLAAGIEDAGFEIRDSIAWLYGGGFPKSMNVATAIEKTAPGSEDAEAWEGWGTAIKPAFEPIVVGRKPLNGTVAANVLMYGTGALHVNACRVPMSDADREIVARGNEAFLASNQRRNTHEILRLGADFETKPADGGRFPANVLLDESQAAALDDQSGVLTSGLMKARTERQPRPGGTIYGADKRNIVAGDTYADSSGASRFFPTFRYEAKAPTSERPNVDGVQHPTVKPLALMRWLVRLVTRPGGRILDPFAGSGTTGEAALLEGMEVDLIELEADHLPLILQRVRKPMTISMFGGWEGEEN